MRLRHVLLLLAGTIVPLEMTAQTWRGWDDYHAIMWSVGSPLSDAWYQRLREISVDGEQCTRGSSDQPMLRNGMNFYVENLIPELAFLNSRASIYQADWKGYTSTQDKKYLTRKPCFHDPAFLDTVRPALQSYIRQYGNDKPLLHNLRDELSIGNYVSPMDYCFCSYTLAAFRAWAQERYASLDALNAEWETSFASWDDVTPLTTYEIKVREQQALDGGTPENLAPWAEHREFMDQTWAETLGKLRDIVHQIDPDTPVGIEGLQMASAWGGYDLWRLSRAVDWVEPYDISNSREIFRSFMPASAPILSTTFGSDANAIRRGLWRLALDGDVGAIIWDDDSDRAIDLSAPDLPIKDRGRMLGSILGEIKPVAKQLMTLTRQDDRIAIHYSQASIRAHWMFDSREDGNTWPKRFSSYEATHSRYSRDRDAMVRLVEDLGLQYTFVSYQQLEAGELIAAGYKVLLLPQSVAMSTAEVQAVNDFVNAGGVVVADNMTATMNEHCKRLTGGQLDDLFGITRASVGWTADAQGGKLVIADALEPILAYEAGLGVVAGDASQTDSGTPVIIQNSTGLGRTVYLNLDVRDYGKLRLTPPQGAALRSVFERIFQDAGITPRATVLNAADDTAVPGVRLWRYTLDDVEYLALMRNPEPDADSFIDFGYPSNAALEQPVDVAITLPAPAKVQNLRTGDDYGTIVRITLTLDPFSPIILELRKADPPAPEAKGNGRGRRPALQKTQVDGAHSARRQAESQGHMAG